MAPDKDWAQKYLIDPLNEPVPSEETGPGTSFRSTFAPMPSNERIASPPRSAGHDGHGPVELLPHPTGHSTESNPYRRRSRSQQPSKSATSTSSRGYPTPPTSASPRHERFPSLDSNGSKSRHVPDYRTSMSDELGGSGGRRRGSSLGERFPGDQSHRPLDMLKQETKKAQRSPHLRRKHQPGADSIDRLGDVAIMGRPLHHEGPYDAALFARNTRVDSSPIAAVAGTNKEALKATPHENIMDSLRRHKPLDGVAAVPPGFQDRFGRVYNYEEGTDMMRDSVGNYKRWPGVEYHPDDLKGKGEPSFTIERALKEHKMRVRHSLGEDYADNDPRSGGGIELRHQQRRPVRANRGSSFSHQDEPVVGDGADGSSGVQRRNTTGRKIGDGLKRRFGSAKGRKPQTQEVA